MVGFLMVFVGRGLEVLLPIYGTHSFTPVSPEPLEEIATATARDAPQRFCCCCWLLRNVRDREHRCWC